MAISASTSFHAASDPALLAEIIGKPLERSIQGSDFFSDLDDSILFLPGNYQIAELFITIDPDITEPQTARIEFTEYPPHGYYTGLANLRFFQPILKDAEIAITPTGIDRDPGASLPYETYIEAYPNPFNGSVNITVSSPVRSRLVIYNLLGQAVKVFPVEIGESSFIWDATDYEGMPVGSGLYFARVENAPSLTTKKLLYLRSLLLPPVTFLQFYVWKAGFLDGFPGFVIALISSWATAMTIGS